MTTTEVPTFTLRERLAKAREHAGLTRDQMAERLSVTERTVRNWENGSTKVTTPIVLAYAAVTSVPVWWLDGDGAGDTMPNIQRYWPEELLNQARSAA